MQLETTGNASLAFYKQCLKWNLIIQSQPVLHITHFHFLSLTVFLLRNPERASKVQMKGIYASKIPRLYELLLDAKFFFFFFSNLNLGLGLNMQQKKKKKVSSNGHMAKDTKSTQTLGALILIYIV